MVNTDLKERIKETAVDHFNKNGYYGTTIRNIANDVNCSLPMIYYYYKNKKELFDEIIKKDFFDILNKQASQVEPGNIVDLYTQFIYGLNDLSDYDKQVYRLGIKVYLSFDGDEELKKVMDDWEKTVFPRHLRLLKPYLTDADHEEAIVRTLVHLLETMIINIIVKNRHMAEEEIREEIAIVLRNCK